LCSPHATHQMRAPRALPCLLLLTLGACFPPRDTREAGDPGPGGGGLRPGEVGPARGGRPGFPGAAPLVIVATKLRGLGTARAGFGFRFGRQEAADHAADVRLAGEERRSGLLGSLAEELSAYSRERGGFRFRFGRAAGPRGRAGASSQPHGQAGPRRL
ncbi:orexigenic neuropeptide QRFP, partial [Macrotis lagotis]|uniref:orexigenic neuropeptide QRFP n=1 Tax=Macrotis lagotis TaxID=92651 RepID=UPI003D693609